MKISTYLDIALRRFNLGVEDPNIEDKFIDFMISLEALFMGGTAELTYKFSNRVAVLLGETDVEKEDIKTFMVKAYNVRSSTVHGEKVRPVCINEQNIPLETMVEKIEEIVRKSILCFIKLSKTYKDKDAVLKELDRSLLNRAAWQKLRRIKHTL